MRFLLCDSFTLRFVLSRSIKLGFFCLKTLSIMNLLAFMSSSHHPFFISIIHACLKKNLSCVYAQWAYDQFVNAHAWVYDQQASPFFHIYYACPSEKKHVLCLCPVGFSLPKIFLCSGLPGFIYEFFH